MQFGILGPIFVRDGEDCITPSAPKQRELLALLLFNAGQVMLAETCIDELWDERPPDSARTTLQTYVLHLRKSMSRAAGGSPRQARGRLATCNGGYCLEVGDGELDLDVFRTRCAEGRTALRKGADHIGAELLGQALAVWRGPALVDVARGPLLNGYITGLEEQRINVLEQRIEADLRLGKHHELLGELSELVVQHPLNENVHAQFMLALYRSGRTAHALKVFREVRAMLRQEVGIDPSVRLRNLHEAILVEDPALEISAHPASRLSLDLMTVVPQQAMSPEHTRALREKQLERGRARLERVSGRRDYGLSVMAPRVQSAARTGS